MLYQTPTPIFVKVKRAIVYKYRFIKLTILMNIGKMLTEVFINEVAIPEVKWKIFTLLLGSRPYFTILFTGYRYCIIESCHKFEAFIR